MSITIMSCHTSFYPAGPLESLTIAPSSLLLSNDFNHEFLNLALLDQGAGTDMPMPYQPNNQDQKPSVPPPIQTETIQPRLRNRQLRPAPQTYRKRSLDNEMNQAAPFFQCPSYTDFSFNEHDHDHNPDQDFGFDEARSHHSDLSSSKSSPTRHSFREDGVQKREKHLERNRAAASKSRQKKKRETDQLKTRFDEVSRKKRLLEEEIKGLHRDLLYLKDQILMHSRCDDRPIHIYLGRMVKQVSKHESMSSASTGEVAARSESPPDIWAQSCQDAEQGVRGLSSPGPGGMSCGVDKPIIDPIMYRPAEDIFDYEIIAS
ncbi:hypothetical protein BDV10DRAFT_178836 [Aspergillus recurvatus]